MLNDIKEKMGKMNEKLKYFNGTLEKNDSH